MGILWRTGCAALIVFLVGCRSAPTPEFTSEPEFRNLIAKESGVKGPPPLPNDSNRIQSGDLLLVLLPEPLPVHKARVRQDGSFEFPSPGAVHVAGKTIEELRTELIERDPRFARGSVTVSCGCFPHFVSGDVKVPGPQPWSSGVTISKAISAAGGLTENVKNRSEQTITLVHSAGRVETIPWPTRLRPSADRKVLPGEHVIVNGVTPPR